MPSTNTAKAVFSSVVSLFLLHCCGLSSMMRSRSAVYGTPSAPPSSAQHYTDSDFRPRLRSSSSVEPFSILHSSVISELRALCPVPIAPATFNFLLLPKGGTSCAEAGVANPWRPATAALCERPCRVTSSPIAIGNHRFRLPSSDCHLTPHVSLYCPKKPRKS